MNVGELKRFIKNLDDNKEFQVYDFKQGRYVSFSLEEYDDFIELEVNNNKGEK